MSKIIILDFVKGRVDIYDIDGDTLVDESYLSKLGYDINNCQWMCGDDVEILYHGEMLK